MGTWATSIFADDTACDVREEFVARFAAGATADDATGEMIRRWAPQVDDTDVGPVFWLALAATQWKYGCLDPVVRSRALEVIDNGSDLGRWSGRDAARREAVLLKLKETLLAPQPAPRRPAARNSVVPAKTEVAAPGGDAVAVASDMGPCASPAPNTLWTQVMIDFGSSGSGVCAIGCGYHEASLFWLDRETLEITYPRSAVLQMRPGQESGAKILNHGRIVNVVYLPRAT